MQPFPGAYINRAAGNSWKLRKFLSKPAADAATQEIAKDITHMSMLEMSDYLVVRE